MRLHLFWFWSTIAVIKCPSPPTILNGNYTPLEPSGMHLYNTTVEYTCQFGYRHLSGSLQRRCNELEQWTGAVPVCTSKYNTGNTTLPAKTTIVPSPPPKTFPQTLCHYSTIPLLHVCCHFLTTTLTEE
ncbi:hypothetical protein DPMN_024171 [Dreissena polymorpha]|uniref:Sushi domain-containing protein n=1 Tax=Dreissena polymorpha TaxID=45954 RepID=A0A9D4LNU6_DREPO|nr:hypothetical protein DPMN_024171 [Dreissena polymorpha]